MSDKQDVDPNVAEIRSHCRPRSQQELSPLIDATRAGDSSARAEVCGALAWSAFCAPSSITATLDAICYPWLGQSYPPASTDTDSLTLNDSFWQAFEAAVVGADAGYDAGSITATVAALGGAVPTEFGELAEAAARSHPGAANAEQRSAPPLLTLSALAQQPEGSLARALHAMLVDNGFDPEVLDREAIGLAELPPALRYLNTRILQMHDVWHLVAGYQTTSLHEIAISAFQLAQFGHNYSAMFLATVAAISHRSSPEGFGVLLHAISEAWLHGRAAPPLMAVEWEAVWGCSIDSVRADLGLSPFESLLPADLLEQAAA